VTPFIPRASERTSISLLSMFINNCSPTAAYEITTAEKVSAVRTEEYFEARARRADLARVSRILARVGKGNPPVEGDELPLEFPARKLRKKR